MNSECKNEAGKNRGYKKVCTGEKNAACKHCGLPMRLSETYTTRVQKMGKVFTSTATRKVDAEAHLAACLVARKSGALMPGEERLIPWSEARDLFYDELARRRESGKSKDTDRVYRSHINILDAEFGRMNLQEISRTHVKQWIRRQMATCGASVINNRMCVLMMILRGFLADHSARQFPRLAETVTDLSSIGKLTLPPRQG